MRLKGVPNGHSAQDGEIVLYDLPTPWVWAVKVGRDLGMIHHYGHCNHDVRWEQAERIKCSRIRTERR